MAELPRPDQISIVLGGEAGQGIQTIEQLLTKILKLAGYHVFATKEYMSRVRGGSNSTSIRVASHPVRAPVQRMDLFIALDRDAIEHLAERISDRTVIIGDQEALATDRELLDIPIMAMAKELGNPRYANTVALGLILGLLKVEHAVMEKYLTERFTNKGEQVVTTNQQAAAKGYERGVSLRDNKRISLPEINRAQIDEEIMLNGSEAIALGAIAGGCKCITSYPMTPGTGVITAMAGLAHDFDLLVEQAEDEIAAINMALGAWYAGGRAMVTTSGGGFALMTEGISLAGMIESPMVVHLAQRPGPATGLPTRTEQADLELALHAGHGEFPRIILAPGSLTDAFQLTHRAFQLADKYQVVVFILTDQYLVDTYYNTPAFDLSGLTINHHLIEAAEDYQRFQLTDSGISPRAVPGSGPGLVTVDSDEHDEGGHITEDFQLRSRMVDKRRGKLDQLQDDELAPNSWWGPDSAAILVLSWGSTNLIVREAVEQLAQGDLAHLALQQIYPLPPEILQLPGSAKRTMIVENNATSQLAKLIRRETGYRIDRQILKYNGLSFTVEELTEALKQNMTA